jgi:ferric-dicitrate binding protein FerR (iron transport regulator)
VTLLERPSDQDRAHGRHPKRSRRRRLVRPLALALALVAVFVVGIAFGQALDDAPEPGGLTTSVRTLTSLPQQPPARTVTVTVTEP